MSYNLRDIRAYLSEEVPSTSTGPAIAGTGDDKDTVAVRKKPSYLTRNKKYKPESLPEKPRNV